MEFLQDSRRTLLKIKFSRVSSCPIGDTQIIKHKDSNCEYTQNLLSKVFQTQGRNNHNLSLSLSGMVDRDCVIPEHSNPDENPQINTQGLKLPT